MLALKKRRVYAVTDPGLVGSGTYPFRPNVMPNSTFSRKFQYMYCTVQYTGIENYDNNDAEEKDKKCRLVGIEVNKSPEFF